MVKGIDVKFSAIDFEAARFTNWEGVRSHQAKKVFDGLIMQSRYNVNSPVRDQVLQAMQVDSKCLFYASSKHISC